MPAAPDFKRHPTLNGEALGSGRFTLLWTSRVILVSGAVSSQQLADRPGHVEHVVLQLERDTAVNDLTVDVELNGTSIFVTAPNPVLEAGDSVSDAFVPDTHDFDPLVDDLRVKILNTGQSKGRLKVYIVCQEEAA